MKAVVSFSCLTVLVLALVVAVAASEGEERQTRLQEEVRILKSGGGKAIPSLVLPTDHVLQVEQEYDGILCGPGPWLPAMEDEFRQKLNSHVIAVAELVQFEGRLVRDDRWIDSEVILQAHDLIQVTNTPIVDPNRRITLRHGGGEMLINGVTVRAGYFFRFSPGQRYLIFVEGTQHRPSLNGVPFKIGEDGTLSPAEMSHGGVIRVESPFYGENVDRILEEFSRRASH